MLGFLVALICNEGRNRMQSADAIRGARLRARPLLLTHAITLAITRTITLAITLVITLVSAHAIKLAIKLASRVQITLTSLTDGLNVLESRCELARVGDRRARELRREIDELSGRRGEAIQKREERVPKMVRRFARQLGRKNVYPEH